MAQERKGWIPTSSASLFIIILTLCITHSRVFGQDTVSFCGTHYWPFVNHGGFIGPCLVFPINPTTCHGPQGSDAVAHAAQTRRPWGSEPCLSWASGPPLGWLGCRGPLEGSEPAASPWLPPLMPHPPLPRQPSAFPRFCGGSRDATTSYRDSRSRGMRLPGFCCPEPCSTALLARGCLSGP